MRARLLLVMPLAIGCSVSESEGRGRRPTPELGAVEQAVIEDGKASAAWGQPGLTTGELQPVAQNTGHLPAGITTDMFTPFGGGGNLLWIADFGANRVVGVTLSPPWSASGLNASYLMGQSGFTSGEPNGGGTTPSNGTLHGPSAVASYYQIVSGTRYLAVADTNNHRVLMGPVFGTPIMASSVYGQHGDFTTAKRNDGGVSAATLDSPAGVAFSATCVSPCAAPERLYIADTGNHRVLLFAGLGVTDATDVFGQADLTSNSENRGGAVGADTLFAPQGLATARRSPLDPSGGFYVADTGNHRVLHFPEAKGSADIVYGQGGSFTTAIPAKGGISASSLRSPSAVAVDSAGGLWVADTGHHRVLHFKKGSTVADRVLGQPNMTTGTAPASVSPSTLLSPTGVAAANNGDIFVADTGASRVLRFAVTSATPDGCVDDDPCTWDRFTVGFGCQHTPTPSSPECFPFSCDLTSHTCRATCGELGAACQPPWQCRSGVCVKPCSDPGACPSGTFCVDGWCCDSPCTSACGACNLVGKEGRCSIVTGRPYGIGRDGLPRTCPGIDAECGGTCTGVDFESCQPAKLSDACGEEFCRDGVAHLRGHCDGGGGCVRVTQECAPYACAPNGCRTSCDFPHHCAPGASCIDGACQAGVDRAPVGGGCGVSPGAQGSGAFAIVLALSLVGKRARRRRS